MSPREMQTLNELDRRIDTPANPLGDAETNNYRKLLLRFVEDALSNGTRFAFRETDSQNMRSLWRSGFASSRRCNEDLRCLRLSPSL
jgi:hypothetical protein